MKDLIPFREQDGCFPAGTLVWTDKGMVPIEQIKVGDKVLSQPETGGEQCYKSVINTFVHEDKTLRQISYTSKSSGKEYVVYTTDNHPFWVEDVGWIRADQLFRYFHEIKLADGTLASVNGNNPVYKTETPGCGWTAYLKDGGDGCVKDFINNKIIANQVLGDPDEDSLLEVRVYNFEVEDFHTYYAGLEGAWVHNSGCVGFFDNRSKKSMNQCCGLD
ncbi:MAG: polymorphic toxin-type HINT domain-containing protein [Gallionella sp.]|nr:polymorphic toxin-type HINT domain-containing protein [Gallionella sp.]MDD4959269.1 polymorphic toxin-type HINT domain-containing protein [Gallionella sp.]